MNTASPSLLVTPSPLHPSTSAPPHRRGARERRGRIPNPQSEIRNPQSAILFLIVGDGVEKARLEARARQMGLCNVRFLPMQPRGRYPAVLHAEAADEIWIRYDLDTHRVVTVDISNFSARVQAAFGPQLTYTERTDPQRIESLEPLKALQDGGEESSL